ncbi:MAG: YbgA family protein [Candidatus Saccharicenans sp.]|nr:MAG: DUF1722 domain-containing protein [Candidatus Aminicenantes bacterium]HEK86005.1 DUF1722 domain-containing protein [Candidatus Aminicenantes bacterium]
MSKPRVVISACLNGLAYRYDGSTVSDKDVDEIKKKFNLINVCPEVGINLGIPRKTIRLVSTEGRLEAIQKDTGLNITQELVDFSENFLTQLSEIDGFILKAKSPSCGVKSAKVFSGIEGQILKKEDGLFAQTVRKIFPFLPLIDEGRLKNPELRWEFLSKTFLHFNFRKATKSISSLVEFHSRAKYMFMSLAQKDLRAMGKILAAHRRDNFPETAKKYQRAFQGILSRPIRKSNLINAFTHMFGYISPRISPEEKAHFLNLLEKYRAGDIDFVVIIELLRSYGLRFQLTYLLNQYLLNLSS